MLIKISLYGHFKHLHKALSFCTRQINENLFNINTKLMSWKLPLLIIFKNAQQFLEGVLSMKKEVLIFKYLLLLFKYPNMLKISKKFKDMK